MIGWAQNWLTLNRHQTTRTTFAVGFVNVVPKSITRTSVFDPHHVEMPGQGTSAGHQRRSAGAIVAGAGIVLDLGFQVYNAYKLHSLKKKVKKLKNIVSTIASEEVVLHNDITALVRVTNRAFAKLTSSIKRLETPLHGTVDTLFHAT